MKNEYKEFLKKYPGINLLEPAEAVEYYKLWKEKNEQLEKLKKDATHI